MTKPATFTILTASPERSGPDPLYWTLCVDDMPLASNDPAVGTPFELEAFELLLSATYGLVPGSFQMLRPRGEPELEPVHIRSHGLDWHWIFPRCYFCGLVAAGIIEDGPAGEVTFQFEYRNVVSQLNAAYRAALATEERIGQAPRLGEGAQPDGASLKERVNAAARACQARAGEPELVVGSAEATRPYRLVPRDPSKTSAQQLQAAWPLPGRDHGARIGVGSPQEHDVMVFQFNDATQQGSWLCSHVERAGRGLPRIADHCQPGGWRSREAPFVPQQSWPMSAYVQWGSKGLVVSRNHDSYTTAFFEAFPSEPKTFIRGEGASVAEAEKSAYDQYLRFAACSNHEFEARGYTNGAGICKHCRMFSSEAFRSTQAPSSGVDD